MMADNEDHGQEKITLTRWELEKENEHAVIKAQIASHEKLIPEIFAAIKSTNISMANIPMEIIKCREDSEKAIKEYIHNSFITDHDLQKFETKLENRMRESERTMTELMRKVMGRVNQGTWIITGAVMAGAVIVWVLTHTNVQIIT